MTIPAPCPLCVRTFRRRVRGQPWLPDPALFCRDHRDLAVQARWANDWNRIVQKSADRTVLESALREKSPKKRRKALQAIAEEG